MTPLPKLCVLLVLLASTGCGKTEPKGDSLETKDPPDQASALSIKEFDALRPEIDRFCGDCHAVPLPEHFPKKAWFDEVAQGYQLYEESGRHDLSPPAMNAVVAYYQHFAPETLELPPVQNAPGPKGVTFTNKQLPFPTDREEPAVSQIAWLPLGDNQSPALLFCDMRTNDLQRVRFSGNEVKTETLARLNHPAAIHPVDFGALGKGLIVAELGTFLPGDHKQGSISWLRPTPDGGAFEPVVLKSELGRVADVRPADFDGDGKMDLVVAEFGWRATGRILLLKQTGQDNGLPLFEETVVDPRHGAIHVPVADLNGDGRADFVALVSQEHETIDAYLNQGQGRFERKRLFQADDPSFGSSGIELTDLDGDGDLDVLYTNGDTLDSHYLKPDHAVHWLENQGNLVFAQHELTRLLGASRAIPADLDGDGDLDIACCSYLPPRIRNQVPGGEFDTLIWLEQDGGEFIRHPIRRAENGHIALASGDFNGDGAPDLAGGAFQSTPNGEWIAFWFTNPPSPSPGNNGEAPRD